LARFGLTYAQQRRRREATQAAERARRQAARTPFALFPVKMDNGEWVWLERYHEQQVWIDCRVCWSTDGWWTTYRHALSQ
jgi:hypothetical protein